MAEDNLNQPESAAAPPEVAAESVPAASASSDSEKSPATELPIYTRNLLNVRVPVSVTLAMKKQPIKHILELAPGSLIQFEKSCDQTLDLCVGEHRIAQGLAVKVGEKFGLRVNHLTPPQERMQVLRSKD